MQGDALVVANPGPTSICLSLHVAPSAVSCSSLQRCGRSEGVARRMGGCELRVAAGVAALLLAAFRAVLAVLLTPCCCVCEPPPASRAALLATSGLATLLRQRLMQRSLTIETSQCLAGAQAERQSSILSKRRNSWRDEASEPFLMQVGILLECTRGLDRWRY